MSPGERVEMYLDDPRLGSGYRRLLVLEVGRKWVTFFHLPTLSKVKLPLAAVERNPTYRAVESNRRTLHRLIKATMKQRRALGLSYSESGTKAALEVL